MSYLLEGNPDRMNFRVKDTGMTPLHAAVKSGSVATLKVTFSYQLPLSHFHFIQILINVYTQANTSLKVKLWRELKKKYYRLSLFNTLDY